MLNQGLWVFDKSGSNQNGGPESLYQFWCNSPGANGQILPACSAIGNPYLVQLVDTQIAFDPFDSRWLATTLAIKKPAETGDLLFAISTSASAIDGTGAWMRYDIPVCPGSQNYPYNLYPDQPVLGYNSSWAAVDTICLDPASNFPNGTDTLVLIPNGSIVNPPLTATPNQSIITPPLAASRPARDISGPGQGFSQLVLASAQFSTQAPNAPEVTLCGIAAPTASATPVATFLSTSPGFLPYGSFSTNQYLAGIPAPQPGCTVPASNCMINISDQGRIQQAVVQYDTAGKFHYLLTAFTSEYSAAYAGFYFVGAGAAFFAGQLETSDWAGEFLAEGNIGVTQTYATIGADPQLDLYATLTNFSPTNYTYSQWNVQRNFETTGQLNLVYGGSLAQSNGVFTGQNTCPTATPTGAFGGPTPSPSATPTPGPILQRWGDYNSMNWDPNQPGLGSGLSGLWSVLQFTQGATDQSTVWTPLPIGQPFLVGNSYGERECDVGSGNICTAKLPAPSGLQNGDVVVAFLDMGGSFVTPPKPPDSTWVELPIANLGGAVSMQQGKCASGLSTEYAYAHVYGSSTETGIYDFKHVVFTICGGYVPEIEGFLAGYRGASTNLSNLLLYGYPAPQPGAAIIVGPAPSNSPSPGILLNVFMGGGYESPESNESGAGYSSLTGSPPATVEPQATGSSPYELADLGIPAAQTPIDQYILTDNLSAFNLWGWQLFMPQ
ncbi:MAG TPA: hypothetical protein VMV27_16315 [Candidatus Binataceae bacterium]|nr:hypothetical protein [Candidatus Binataceae bacterium]